MFLAPCLVLFLSLLFRCIYGIIENYKILSFISPLLTASRVDKLKVSPVQSLLLQFSSLPWWSTSRLINFTNLPFNSHHFPQSQTCKKWDSICSPFGLIFVKYQKFQIKKRRKLIYLLSYPWYINVRVYS